MNTLLFISIVLYSLLVIHSSEIYARPPNEENAVLKNSNTQQHRENNFKVKFAKYPKYRYKYSNEPETLSNEFENYSIKLYQTFRVTMHNLEREFHKDLMKFRKYNRNILKI